MIKQCLIVFSSFILSIQSPAQEFGSLKDSRDGRIYKTVKIGEQVWMAENLNAEKFQNGDTIFNAATKEQWDLAAIKKQPAWCYYNNNPKNEREYAKLYNWYAISDSRGLAPNGWHVPSLDEWHIFILSLGGYSFAGKKLKTKEGWQTQKYYIGNINPSGTNESGFSALPTGGRDCSSKFDLAGSACILWTSNEKSLNAIAVNLSYYDTSALSGEYCKSGGFSLRCIRD